MTRVSKEKALDFASGEVLVAEFDGVQVIGKLSGKPTGFFAAHRNFDDQMYFMQLISAGFTGAYEDDVLLAFADRVLLDTRKELALVTAEKGNR
jgi:hypothetical protein